MRREQEVPVLGCCDRTGELAKRAHERGEIFYLTKDGRALAAIVPVGFKGTAASQAALDAAYDAAFPGLPKGMTEGEARRRLKAALNASYMHFADALEEAEKRGAKEALKDLSEALKGLADKAPDPEGHVIRMPLDPEVRAAIFDKFRPR